MNLSAMSRDWFAVHSSAEQFRTRDQFRDAMGLTTEKAREVVGTLRNRGHIVSDGTHHGCGYRWVGPDEHLGLRAHYRSAERARLARRRKAMGAPTRSEQAIAKAERSRLAALDRAIAVVQRMKASAAPRRKPGPRTAGTPVFRNGRKLRRIDCSSVVAHIAAPRLQTSSEWLAASATRRVEVIAPGIVSAASQFKHIANRSRA